MTPAESRLSKKPAWHARRKKWIRGDLQMKIFLMTLFVAALVLIVDFQLTLIGLWVLSNHLAATADAILYQVKSLVLRKFLISVGVTVPLSLWVGAIYAFRFCGPIYRFKKYFNDLETGSWGQDCTLRKGDELQDVKDAINGSVGLLREKVQDQHRLLEEARTILAEPSISFPDRGKVEELISRMTQEEKEFQRRFGSPGRTGVESEPQAERTVATA